MQIRKRSDLDSLQLFWDKKASGTRVSPVRKVYHVYEVSEEGLISGGTFCEYKC